MNAHTTESAFPQDHQHPLYADGAWAAHCQLCFVYAADWYRQPPSGLLCPDCEEADGLADTSTRVDHHALGLVA